MMTCQFLVLHAQACFSPVRAWISRYSYFPTSLDGSAETGFSYMLKPVSILSMGGSADIATFREFDIVSDLFQSSLDGPAETGLSSYMLKPVSAQTCFSPVHGRISRYSYFPRISHSFRPVSDLFGRPSRNVKHKHKKHTRRRISRKPKATVF